MSTSLETKPPVEPEFDFLAFWIQHKQKVVIFSILLLVGLISFGVFQFTRMRAEQAATRDLAKAKSTEDYRRVADQHEGSTAAGNALLLLAEQLRAESKFDESNAALQRMIEKYPTHPMISGAWISLAVNQEAQGKTDEALATYQKVAATYPNTFSAPAALLAQGRIFAAKGKIEDARRAYETVISQFGESLYGRIATQENQMLK